MMEGGKGMNDNTVMFMLTKVLIYTLPKKLISGLVLNTS